MSGLGKGRKGRAQSLLEIESEFRRPASSLCFPSFPSSMLLRSSRQSRNTFRLYWAATPLSSSSPVRLRAMDSRHLSVLRLKDRAFLPPSPCRPQHTIATAVVFFQRFFVFKSFKNYNNRVCALFGAVVAGVSAGEPRLSELWPCRE